MSPAHALGVPTTPGLSQLLSRGCSAEQAVHPTDVRNLSVVPRGGEQSTRLEPEDLRLILKKMERRAFVVIDAPPVLASADSVLLTEVADLVVLVGDLRAGTRTDARDALALLDDVRPKLTGWVANAPPRRRELRRVPQEISPTPPPEAPDPTAPEPRDEARSVKAPLDPDQDHTCPELDRPATAAMKARPRRDRKSPAVPRQVTAPPDGVRPFRGPHGAARRR
jgi:hypothetical protein